MSATGDWAGVSIVLRIGRAGHEVSDSVGLVHMTKTAGAVFEPPQAGPKGEGADGPE